MKKFTNVIKAFSFLVFTLWVSMGALAQTPNYIGTDIADGNYIHVVFPTIGNISSQYRVQATSSAPSGTRILEFTATASYTDVWRPYTPGNVLPAFNTMIDPATQNASARYNSSFGGNSLLLPAITAGNYYTINIMNNRGNANDTMSVLQTNYNPVVISTVSQSPVAGSVTTNCSVTVTALLAAAPSAGEYIYLRYSTVAFGNASEAIMMNVAGTTATATIPALPSGSNVQYYILSSPLPSLATTGQASGYYDCLTLNINNNGGTNYQYSVTAAPVPDVSISALHNNFCSLVPVADTFIANPVNAGATPTFQWYKNGVSVPSATDDTFIDPALNNNDSIWVVMTASVVCAVPDTSNTIYVNLNFSVTTGVSASVSDDSICSGAIDTFFATSTNGGSAPVYQWYKNGAPVGSNDSMYIDATLNDQDSVWVVMTNNTQCAISASDTSNHIIVDVFAVPASGSLTPSPAMGNVCDGANVSATATVGSGGVGMIADSLQYRYDGGTWQSYASGTALTTTGHTSVDIQTYRTATGPGCTMSIPNTVSWTVVAQPISGSLTGSPAPGNICDGVPVSATSTAGSGGAGTVTDSVQYNFDGGTWQNHAPGNNLATSGHTSVSIRTFRTATGAGCNRSSDSTISWTILPIPTNNIGSGPINQCGGSVTLDAGNPGSTYLWSDGSTNRRDTISSSATYSVTVTSAFGCKDTFSRDAYIKPVPVVNLGADQNLCGGNTTLDAGNPGASYVWTGGSTGQFLTVSSTGIYAVTVTDSSSQCTGTDSVMVTITTPPTVSLGTDTAICGGTLTLDAGNAGATYHWNDSSSAQTHNVTGTGLYSVTVTDAAGCTGSDSRLVTENNQPNLGADVTDSICPSSTADLYHYYQGSGLSLTYNTAAPSMVAPGTYTVVGTSSSGCADTAMITITIRSSASAGPDMVDSVCIGSTADLTALIPNSGFATYAWNTASPQNAPPGVYQLVVGNGNGCTDTAIASVYDRVSQPIVDLGPDSVQCGGTITLSAELNGATYLWSDSSTSYQLVVSSTGIYSVTVTNTNGCSATDSKLVVIHPKPDLGADVIDSICPGSRANLYNYYINSGLALIYNTMTPSSVDSGTYTIIGTNSNGCMDTAQVMIIYRQKPDAGVDRIDSICPGYKYDLTTLYPNIGYSSYTWNTANATAVDTGTYMLIVSNTSGCTDTAIATITQRIKPNLGGNKTDSICIGYTYDLRTLYPDSNIYVSYVWNTTNDSAATAGTYQLVVTNASGCTDTAYATITFKMRPTVTLPAYPNMCITNPSFLLTGGSPLGGIYRINNVADSIFSPAGLGAATHYVVYVYTNIQGCTDSAIRYITVYPQPIIYDTIPLPNLCTGSPLLDLNNYFTPNGGAFSGAGVSGNYFYPNLAPTGSDSITYIYTDNNGCIDTAGRRISIIPSVNVSLHTNQSNLTICNGQPITFTAGGASLYQFFVNDSAVTTRDTTSTFTSTSLHNHDQVTVVGSNYCSSDTSEFIIIDVLNLPTVVAGPDTTIDLGQTVQLYANGTGSTTLIYSWTPDSSLSMTNIPNPIYSGTDTITFTVLVTDANGCTATDKVTINVRIPDNIQLPNVITPNGDGKNDTWTLNPKIDLAGSHVVIFNRWGEVVYEADNYANNWAGTYKDTGHKVPDGTYYYVLSVPTQHGHVYRGPINILSSGSN